MSKLPQPAFTSTDDIAPVTTILSPYPMELGNEQIGEMKLVLGANEVDEQHFAACVAASDYVQQLLDTKVLRELPNITTPEDVMLRDIANADEARLLDIAQREGRPRCRAAMSRRWYALVESGQYSANSPGSHYFRNTFRDMRDP